jgi:mono/diheme cytochrome c family protein
MRQNVARRIAFGAGALVTGAALVFATLQQARTGDASPLTGVPGALPPSPGPGPAATEHGATDPLAGVPGDTATDTLSAFGRRVYEEEGCADCHSIAGVGGRRSALDGVGTRLTEDRIRLWIVDPQAARAGIRKPAYDDLAPERLDALVAFLRTLR